MQIFKITFNQTYSHYFGLGNVRKIETLASLVQALYNKRQL